jgi:hypothetical protein
MASESDGTALVEAAGGEVALDELVPPRKSTTKKSVRFDETPTIVSYEPQVEYVPTPSLITKELTARFRIALWVLLVRRIDFVLKSKPNSRNQLLLSIQIIHTLRLTLLADSISVVNFFLLFVAFYGQDLLRVSALTIVRNMC